MSLRRRIFSVALVGFFGLSSAFYAGVAEAAEEAGQGGLEMTHMQLAQAIVRALGLQSDLDVSATPADHATYLQGRGIAPLRGWIAGAQVTKEDLAVVSVEGLGLLGEVEDPKLPEAYMAVLDSRQISLATVADVIANVTVQSAITELVLYSPIAVLYETFLSPIEAW